MDQCNHGVGAESIEMRRRLRVGPRPDPEEKRQPNHRATALPAPTTDDSAGQQGLYGRLSLRYSHLKLVPVCTPRLRTLYPLSTISLTSGRPFLEPTANPLVTSCHLRHV